MTSVFDLDFAEPSPLPPSGHGDRFGGRWRLTGAGLSNVWRFGDLLLPAHSGRLLLRGPNGTGKTTALEALWPFLLDLNPARLAAGKARPTTLNLLMGEGATSRRRYGYAWLTLAAPQPLVDAGEETPTTSFGVRLQYAAGSSPQVRLVPFTVPGEPLTDIALYREDRTAFEFDEFTETIERAGGQVFESPEDYTDHLARRVWRGDLSELTSFAAAVREVRNPTLLADVSPNAAAEALRRALPGVDDGVLNATADALAESATTRRAFEQDRNAAEVLGAFAEVWSGHAVEVVRQAHAASEEAILDLRSRRRAVSHAAGRATAARDALAGAIRSLSEMEQELRRLAGDIRAIEMSDAYRQAGRLVDLQTALAAEQRAAAAELSRLHDAASGAADQTSRGREDLLDRAEDLAGLVRAAITAGAEHISPESILSWTERPRRNYLVPAGLADPGPGLTIRYEQAAVDARVGDWLTRRDQRRARAGAAQLALKDHVEVRTAETAFRSRQGVAEESERARDEAEQVARQAERSVGSVAGAVRDAVRSWARTHPDLRESEARAIEQHDPRAPAASWTEADLEELGGVEPAQLLSRLQAWSELAARLGEGLAARAEADARALAEAAASLRDDAVEHRRAAEALRSGGLLPLPRPDWAAAGDDSQAIGSVLEWRARDSPGSAGSSRSADLIESALGRCGLLGATLAGTGVGTDRWQVSAVGPQLGGPTLSDVLDVDRNHSLAEVASAVLQRVRLADSAAGQDADHALVVGRDGSFRAGVLLGSADPDVPAARFVGARQRRAAALAEADRLSALADELDSTAAERTQSSVALRTLAGSHRRRAASFPARDDLRVAEARRAASADVLQKAAGQAATHRAEADDLREAWSRLRSEWVSRTTGLGLPTTLEELDVVLATERTAARDLEQAAQTLGRSWSTRLRRTLAELPDEADLELRLASQYEQVQRTHGQAARTEALVTELLRTVGDPAEAVSRHRDLSQEHVRLGNRIGPEQTHRMNSQSALDRAEATLEAAGAELRRTQPLAASLSRHLRHLLSQPAVAFVFGALPGSDGERGDEDLQAWTAERLAGRRSSSRRQLSDRYDQVSAALAGRWTLSHGEAAEDLPDLDLIVLSHADQEYAPPSAAVRAQELAARAQRALAGAEAAALNDFVIGRLPSAIGTAWTRLLDWRSDVNAKMRSAEASSGVGVQVQIDLAHDLPPHVRVVYELSCRVSDADRTAEQKAEVGAALQALLAGADGDNMLERLRDAVDIRTWVDVHYLVTRPNRGQRVTGRWTSRTGLSGGERRLVVLAPMLAALAAACDRLGAGGLRLIALDEVPAEVDERGRQGLARLLAELDLDLICTSYLWDGAPGAWDGVDAHDLEVAADGTVVAFWMLVRGREPLPGEVLPPEPADTD